MKIIYQADDGAKFESEIECATMNGQEKYVMQSQRKSCECFHTMQR